MDQHTKPNIAAASKRKAFFVKAGVFVFMLAIGYLVGGGIAKSIRHLQTTQQSTTSH